MRALLIAVNVLIILILLMFFVNGILAISIGFVQYGGIRAQILANLFLIGPFPSIISFAFSLYTAKDDKNVSNISAIVSIILGILFISFFWIFASIR